MQAPNVCRVCSRARQSSSIALRPAQCTKHHIKCHQLQPYLKAYNHGDEQAEPSIRKRTHRTVFQIQGSNINHAGHLTTVRRKDGAGNSGFQQLEMRQCGVGTRARDKGRGRVRNVASEVQQAKDKRIKAMDAQEHKTARAWCVVTDSETEPVMPVEGPARSSS
eukprot:2368506-Pleurochrysis_carterae.AAC.2